MLRKYTPYALIMLLSIPLITSAADLSQNLDALFHTNDIARQEELIAEISDHDVPINTLITLLKNAEFKKGTARGIRTAKICVLMVLKDPTIYTFQRIMTITRKHRSWYIFMVGLVEKTSVKMM